MSSRAEKQELAIQECKNNKGNPHEPQTYPITEEFIQKYPVSGDFYRFLGIPSIPGYLIQKLYDAFVKDYSSYSNDIEYIANNRKLVANMLLEHDNTPLKIIFEILDNLDEWNNPGLSFLIPVSSPVDKIVAIYNHENIPSVVKNHAEKYFLECDTDKLITYLEKTTPYTNLADLPKEILATMV